MPAPIPSSRWCSGTITDTNVHRITVQMDMGGGTCAAWLDGTETSTLALGSVLNSDGSVNVNKQLWRYEQGAFQLGQLNSGALGTPTASGLNDTQQQVNWTYCGFQLIEYLALYLGHHADARRQRAHG